MRKHMAYVLVIVLVLSCVMGCIGRGEAKTETVEPAKTDAPGSSGEEASSTSAPATTDPVTEAFEAGRYLDAIRLYEEALRDPGAFITEKMKESYSSSIEKYVEMTQTKAEIAFGTNKDINAALQVLQGALDAASQYDAVTGPIESTISRYMSLYHEDVIDKAFQAEDYLTVVREYEYVVAEGIQITEQMAQQRAACNDRYLEKLDAEAKAALGENHDYDAAIRSLSKHMEEVSEYYEIYGKLEDLIYDYIADKYEYLVNKAYEEGNYLEVARQYEKAASYDVTNPSETMQKQYEDSVAQYLKKVTDEAKRAFGKKKDYNAAMTRIRASLSEANDVEAIVGQLEVMLEEYAAYTPIPLTSLKYTQKTSILNIGDRYTDEETLKDVNGVRHSMDSMFFLDHYTSADKEEESYIEYNLNYQYSTFTGVVYRPYSSLSSTKKWNSPGVAKIYGDGQLLFESPQITKDTYDAYPFSVDVSGVRNLRIILFGQWSKKDSWGSVYYSKVCLGDLMLQK